MWETYSAFANTCGGIILLGVKENSNGELQPVGLNEIEANNLIKNFWNTINSNKVNINLLNNKDVKFDIINNNYIVIINVPLATSQQKPVYINNNIITGTYRRNYEGDYKCSIYEIQAMLRDKDTISNDSYIILDKSVDILKTDTLNTYINHFKNVRGETHPFVKGDTNTFLYQIGAANYDNEGILRPTKAGLLMFGYEYDISKYYPNYFLDYQDHRNTIENARWSQRIISSSGDWSGNLYDFYFRVVNKLLEDVKRPFKLEGIFRVDDTNIHKAIREILCNTISNADYNESSGVVIKQYDDKLVFSNPGLLALPIEKMILGGDSQARNKLILKIFSLVNIGERAGSGIPLIFTSAEENNLKTPTICEAINPSQTKTTFYLIPKKFEESNYKSSNPSNIINNTYNKLASSGHSDDSSYGTSMSNGYSDGSNCSKSHSLSINEHLNANFDTIIASLKIKDAIKNKLQFSYHAFYNDIISASLISNHLNCGKTSANKYMNILLNNNLIEPIIGQGRGRYIFKKIHNKLNYI